MPTISDTELYVASGFLSGLEAMSEIRELLEELYGDTSPEPPDEG